MMSACVPGAVRSSGIRDGMGMTTSYRQVPVLRFRLNRVPEVRLNRVPEVRLNRNRNTGTVVITPAPLSAMGTSLARHPARHARCLRERGAATRAVEKALQVLRPI